MSEVTTRYPWEVIAPCDAGKPTPRGVRNNNPGNLRHDGWVRWAGEMPPDPDGFCRFETAFYGIRAMALNLVRYWQRDKITNLRECIARWAPPASNDTGAYLTYVCNYLKADPDAPFEIIPHLPDLTCAIIFFECGCCPYTARGIYYVTQAAIRTSGVHTHE